MHYLAYVLIGPDGDPEAQVEALMAPHRENFDVEPSTGFWDWYQIGGRWSGHLDGYDPEKDPKNIEKCTLCGATGKRFDMVVASGCNGCSGNGVRLAWPTQWVKHLGDVQSASVAVAKAEMPYTLVTEGVVLQKEVWDGSDFTKTDDFETRAKALLLEHASRNGRVVVVDYHS